VRFAEHRRSRTRDPDSITSHATGAGKSTIINPERDPGHPQGVRFFDGVAVDRCREDVVAGQSQVRLPAGVIGGGLTAIDTATELMAYYPISRKAAEALRADLRRSQ
jgi:hypothetical protein